MDLIIARNDKALKYVKIAENSDRRFHRQMEALITGLCWDEQPEREKEEYFSCRDAPPHLRVHLILHFPEMDIRQYINGHQMPYCSLYRRGFRRLG